MLKDPFIGIYVAQMHREMRNYEMANAMYNTILDMKPNSCSIYLKLALGFIRCKEANKARQCLDYVEERTPNDTRYLHYKGIYLQKFLNYKKGALEHFEKAGSLLNFISDLSYLELKLQMAAGAYNPIPYLEIMLKRYEELGGYRLQVILLNMGTYMYSVHDEKNACKYYLQAIEIDPRSKILRKFYSHVTSYVKNILEILNMFIIPILKSQKNVDKQTS